MFSCVVAREFMKELPIVIMLHVVSLDWRYSDLISTGPNGQE